MPTRGKKDPNGRALRGRRAHTTFISDPIAQIWSNYNVRSGANGAATPEQPAVQNCLYDRFEALYKKSSIKPSLVIVPARFKSGTLYSEIPTANGDFNVTRATTATRVNASGFIEVVASGIPRLDYFASGGVVGCPALLVEPSGQNLALQSENFVTTWAANNLNITSGFTSPFNNANGTLIEATSVAGRLRQTIAAITSGTTHTFSLFAKADSFALTSGITLTVNDGTSSNYASGVCQAFRLDTGALGTSGTVGAGFTLTRASIENYGNGWYRCNMTVTASYTPATSIIGVRATSTISAGLPSTASGSTVYIWGAQLETGSVATSYIPTTTAAVTRNADLIFTSGAVSGSIGQTQGTIYAEVDISAFVTGKRLVELSNGSAANRMIISVQGSQIQFLVINASSTQATINSATLSVGTFKIAAAYASNDFVFYVNGVQAGEDFIGTVPTLNQINIGSAWNSILQFNDRIRAAALYTTRLTNAQLAFITQP